jgi:hypothetical protein
MKKSFVLLLAIPLFGCNTPSSFKDINTPKFNVFWQYEKDTIKFSVENLTTEDMLMALPLEEKKGEVKKFDYNIFNRDEKNFAITNIGLSYPIGNADFKIISGVYKQGAPIKGGQEYDFQVPNLTKKIEDIFKIEVMIHAVPISQLTTVNNTSSFLELFRQNEQTYVVDFSKVGYKKQRGKMELKPNSNTDPKP